MKQFKPFTIFFSLMLIIALILPVLAQDSTPSDSSSNETFEADISVTGLVAFVDGELTVDGIYIAPAGQFQPSELEDGMMITVTGYLLNDTTLKATEPYVLAAETTPEPEITPEMTPEAEVTPETTPEMTPEAEVTPELTPEATSEADDCALGTHPVANALAANFGVDVATILGWHCNGFGFGEIARALKLAELTGTGAQSYLDARDAGEGWGNIVKEAGVSPSELAPGKAINKGNGNGNANANSNANANTNSNNGKSNGKANGKSNGNGKANGKSNGNGKANGRGHNN